MAAARAIPERRNEMINAQPKGRRGHSVWTPERRAAASARARAQKLWRHTTGPKTAAGKARSARNSYKHGLYSVQTLEFKKFLRLQSRFLRALNRWITAARANTSVIARRSPSNPDKKAGWPRRHAPRKDGAGPSHPASNLLRWPPVFLTRQNRSEKRT